MLAARGIGVVAISVDDVDAGQALTTRLGLGFPIVADPTAATVKAFGVFDPGNEIAWPSIFIVNADGTIAKRWLADTYKLRIATADVLADL